MNPYKSPDNLDANRLAEPSELDSKLKHSGSLTGTAIGAVVGTLVGWAVYWIMTGPSFKTAGLFGIGTGLFLMVGGGVVGANYFRRRFGR